MPLRASVAGRWLSMVDRRLPASRYHAAMQRARADGPHSPGHVKSPTVALRYVTSPTVARRSGSPVHRRMGDLRLRKSAWKREAIQRCWNRTAHGYPHTVRHAQLRIAPSPIRPSWEKGTGDEGDPAAGSTRAESGVIMGAHDDAAAASAVGR